MSDKTHHGFAQDGGMIRPLAEGYIRRGGQVQAPASASPRPAPPAPFRPAPPPAAPAPSEGAKGK